MEDGRMAMDRRRFLGRALLVAGGAAMGAFPGCAGADLRRVGEGAGHPMPFRTLGRTGMKVSAVSFGAMQCSDPAVVRHAVEMGVNLIDTADCYMGGQNERLVGEAVA